MRLLYQCEKCGSAYITQAIALACEAFELPPPPVPVGGQITVITRYDGDAKATVKEWSLSTAFAPEILAHYTIEQYEKVKDDEDFQKMHQWVATIDRMLQIGKDFHTGRIPAWAIRELKRQGSELVFSLLKKPITAAS